MTISDRLPELYFPEIEAKHPGALASQWIPTDPSLWKIERYRDFLEARKELLAAEANKRFEELLHGDNKWLSSNDLPVVTTTSGLVGCVTSETEEQELEALNDWIESLDLPRGHVNYDYSDGKTGAQQAIFDLAWPIGLQAELTTPVAVLLDEPIEVISLASRAGFRCFTTIDEFRIYVENEILNLGAN